MKRVLPWVAWLLFNASCAATGIGSPGAEAGDANAPHERAIDRREFRLAWPFTIGTGTLSCDSGAVVVRLADVSYGLNDEALRRGFPSTAPVLLQRRVPPTNPLGRLPQGDRERVFRSAETCGRANDPDGCRSSVARRHGLTVAELEQVLAEGRERHWPPLEPQRMSVNPIVEAGLRLCP